MLRKVIIHRFKKFPVLEINLKKKVFVVGPNNSGKTTVLQALALGAEIGSAWFKTIEELDLDYRHADAVEVDFCSNFSMAWEHLNELWYNKDITHSIDVKLVADDFNVGFCLGYVNTETVSIRPSSNTRPDTLAAYAQAPLKAMYIPSLSGLNTEESEYKTAAIRAHIAQGQSGSVLRSLIAEVSLDEEKWTKLQQTVGDMFGGAEISRPSGTAPIIVRYRDSPESHWHRLINASAGFLQTVLVQSALLHSDATLFLIDEPDAHLHTLLKESMDRIISKHCDDNDCQVLIATHSSLLIDTANKEGGQNLFLISAKALRPVGRRQAKVLLKIPFNEIVLAETTQRILYVEGRSDLDILRAWASVLNHPAGRYLNNPFWIATAERPKNNNSKSHYQALKAQVPTLQALEIQDRNGKEHEGWDNLNLGQLRQGDGQNACGHATCLLDTPRNRKLPSSPEDATAISDSSDREKQSAGAYKLFVCAGSHQGSVRSHRSTSITRQKNACQRAQESRSPPQGIRLRQDSECNASL